MGCCSAIKGAALDAVRIVLEMDKFENCLDRLKSSKAFLETPGGIFGSIGWVTQIIATTTNTAVQYNLPTQGQYEEHLTQYYELMKKYNDIIDRDISTIKASARRIMTADTKG